MKIITENRASIILYNIILSNDIGKGITLLPANICPIVPATMLKADAKFDFIDINNEDFSIDTNAILKRIQNEKNISSILVSDTYGVELEREIFFTKVKAINDKIFIIYDRCLNIPYLKPIETIADMILHSTGYSKYVDLSYGGYAFVQNNVKYYKEDLKYNEACHNKLIEEFNEALKNKNKFYYSDTDWLGNCLLNVNTRAYFDEIKLKLKEVKFYKEKINKIYQKNIDEQFHIGEQYNNWRFNILVNNKDEVLKQIFKDKLFASSHYQSLVGVFNDGVAKNANFLHSKVINLFNDFRFTEEKAYLVSEIVNRYAR
jgi:dTDP-4-amino-4,6-dideoxygalactose transaminase